ncbi:MAG: Ldh family oxidoreductase [Planctomycetes bacterium]|nr:Ldh family oxidoreductase [Planctomycetota bacterium]
MKPERVAADRLRKFSIAVFEAAGAPRGHAERATDVLIWASLRGVDTHGIRNLKRYYLDASGVGRRDGKIELDAELTLDHESPTTAAFNAHSGLALSLSVQAMECAIEKARESGVGVVTVRNSTHFGAAGYYASMAVEHDMLGFASCGYLFPHGQAKSVLPFGGILPMLSTNPLAMACPADKMPPYVLDMSTSIVPVNRIELYEEEAKPVPSDWALDTNGDPTAKADQVHSVNPLGGAITFGGHKGYGLAIASWILTGLLSGAWRTDAERARVLGDTPERKHGFSQEGIAHSFAAIRIDQFGDPQVFRRGMDAMIHAINDSPPAEGFEQVQVPGQGAHATEQERRREGIPINAATMAALRSLAEEYGVPL